MAKKELTLGDIYESINELARMTKVGFDGVDEKFKKIEKTIDAMQTDIKSLKDGQKDIKAVLEHVAVKSEVAETKERVTDLEIQFRRLKAAHV